MKLFLLAALASSASAFAPTPSAGRRSVALRSAGSDAIAAAMEASKKYGASSQEARVLWDIVEEIDASDNSAAYKPAVEDAEYENKVKALSQMLTKTKDELDAMKALADDLKGVKLAAPPAGESSSSSSSAEEAMTAALVAARAATEEHGAESTEARLAWETVEEIASSGSAEATKAPLDEECLIELIEGCEALEKFKAALEERS
ncbi:hypothetical protein ACHAWF_002519 [Thalassiosira exigua]